MTTKTKKSQKSRILTHLRNGKKVNTISAVAKFGAYRLSAIMWTLKHEDKMSIKKEKVTLRNPKGGFSHVTSYRLAA